MQSSNDEDTLEYFCFCHGEVFTIEYQFAVRTLVNNGVVCADDVRELDNAVCCCSGRGSTAWMFAKIPRRKLIIWADRAAQDPVSNIDFLSPTLKHFTGLLSLNKGDTKKNKAIHIFLNCIRSLSNGFCPSFAKIVPNKSRRSLQKRNQKKVDQLGDNSEALAETNTCTVKPKPRNNVNKSPEKQNRGDVTVTVDEHWPRLERHNPPSCACVVTKYIPHRNTYPDTSIESLYGLKRRGKGAMTRPLDDFITTYTSSPRKPIYSRHQFSTAKYDDGGTKNDDVEGACDEWVHLDHNSNLEKTDNVDNENGEATDMNVTEKSHKRDKKTSMNLYNVVIQKYSKLPASGEILNYRKLKESEQCATTRLKCEVEYMYLDSDDVTIDDISADDDHDDGIVSIKITKLDKRRRRKKMTVGIYTNNFRVKDYLEISSRKRRGKLAKQSKGIMTVKSAAKNRFHRKHTWKVWRDPMIDGMITREMVQRKNSRCRCCLATFGTIDHPYDPCTYHSGFFDAARKEWTCCRKSVDKFEDKPTSAMHQTTGCCKGCHQYRATKDMSGCNRKKPRKDCW
ncbi:uncharacterized protein LOC144437743 [Glandiceps talaboti]